MEEHTGIPQVHSRGGRPWPPVRAGAGSVWPLGQEPGHGHEDYPHSDVIWFRIPGVKHGLESVYIAVLQGPLGSPAPRLPGSQAPRLSC